MDLTERTIDSREVFRGRIIRVRQDTVRLPNGKESSREVVEHPGAVPHGAAGAEGGDRRRGRTVDGAGGAHRVAGVLRRDAVSLYGGGSDVRGDPSG